MFLLDLSRISSIEGSQSVGKSSRSVFLPFGVPQGSVLGPILYTLYNSPLHDIASAHGISDHYYADDEQLYCSFRPTTEGGEQRLAFSALADCVRDTKNWASDNRLKFNDDKTDAMVISAKIIRKNSTMKIDPLSMPLIVGESAIFYKSPQSGGNPRFSSHHGASDF